MTALILIAALIAVVTVWFVARPLRTTGTSTIEDREALIQLRDRLLGQLREIEVESGDRNIDETVAADERRRLEAELARVLKELDQMAGDAAKSSVAPKGMWLNTLFALAAILPIASATLYLVKNAPTLVKLTDAKAQPQPQQPGNTTTARAQVPPMVLEMVGRLEQRLAEKPADPKGWAQLGRAYGVLGRQDDARKAYAKAFQQAPNDKEIVQAYVTFLVALSPNQLSPEAKAVFAHLLKLEPQNMGALWALGLGAYYDKQYAQALKYWDPLLKQLPPEGSDAADVRRAMDAARAEMSGAKKVN
jgi:cytochrome c-type biogenesis protein CcmH